MYKLFTNDKPFQDFNVQQLMEIAPLYKGDLKFISKYAVLFTEIPPHANVNEVSMDIIKSLLNTDDTKRLGCGEQGAREIKNHPFFEGIDWEQLEAKQIPPPFIPERKQRSNAPQFDGFEDMMCQLGKEKWITEEMPKWNQQRYFGQWDYTSPQTLKLECQLAEEAAQYESHMGSWNKMSDKRKNLSLSELSEKLSIGITNPPKRSITQTIMQGLSPLASARKQEV